MSDVAVQVDSLSKLYRIGKRQMYKTARETITSAAMWPFTAARRLLSPAPEPAEDATALWALKDVSFTINRGEVVGIIGRNGAGKSTLLKVLSRITEPTSGRIRIHGRVGSLLEVGTGFHPELTGRENVFLNGAILGMKRAEIARQFDAIIGFAEIDKFVDTPVKHYSSGMYTRLAFAVAAHLEPEILIVDEVLAVGDAQFQKKCLGKMSEVAGNGRTVLFVSHNMAAVQSLCQTCILMDSGRVRTSGRADIVVNEYFKRLDDHIDTVSLANRTDRTGSGRIRLTSFHAENSAGHVVQAIGSGTDVDFVLGYQAAGTEPIANVDVGFSLHEQDGSILTVLYSSYKGTLFTTHSTTGEFRCRIKRFPLPDGRYGVGARIFVNRVEADWPQDGVGFVDVEAADFYGSGSRGFTEGRTHLLVDGEWSTQPVDAPAALPAGSAR